MHNIGWVWEWGWELGWELGWGLGGWGVGAIGVPCYLTHGNTYQKEALTLVTQHIVNTDALVMKCMCSDAPRSLRGICKYI